MAISKLRLEQLSETEARWQMDDIDPDEVSVMARELLALRWQPITPENLPKVGDEVVGPGRKVTEVEDWLTGMLGTDQRVWFQNHYTHFRPINPPAPPEEKP